MKTLTYIFFCALLLVGCSVDTFEFPEEITTSVDIEETVPSVDLIEMETAATPEFALTVQESKALRTTLEALRDGLPSEEQEAAAKANADQNNALCFQFVYPLTVEYNDGSLAEIPDYDTLLQILLDESTTSHLTGVGFPFDVLNKADNTEYTINDEEEFKALLSACGYDAIDYTYVINTFSPCFRVNYPLDFIINDTVKTFDSEKEVKSYFNTNWTSSSTVTISYPFRIVLTQSDDIISIENDFEMINLVKNICNIR